MEKKEQAGRLISMRIITILILFIGFVSCKQDSSVANLDTAPKAAVSIPGVNADSLYSFVESQLEFGHRIPGTDGHTACRDWIVNKMESYGATVQLQNFKASFYDVKDIDAYNIIASFNPNNPHRLLLAAHWDTRMVAEKDKDETMKDKAIMGADDGASGVSGLLEIARMISTNPIDLGVDFIFFDAEDNGFPERTDTWCLGSQYWAKNMHQPNYNPKFGILLDMIGAKGAVFPKEVTSQRYAKKYQDKLWDLGQRMGYKDMFVNDQVGGFYDDHVPVNEAGIPMMDIINYDIGRKTFAHYHHTHEDDISIIDKRTLRVVAQVVTSVLYKESTLNF